ncbi:YagK/YfjJ domain-containing protein [Methylophaga thiooxydans]|uniref:YagK/YfjJ C-terminal domain-containing protein n=1 Tax=Methylophaga thiooxydans DMS010 TaxID=637616 RepID=C0N6F9_9GAMM|nr:inovirus-type Gp2 protein [Methylophaga thiooxydans]EEF79274.1 hypothetical protein MDMS009_1861 [Methylophaga thiooxydans DMS010]
MNKLKNPPGGFDRAELSETKKLGLSASAVSPNFEIQDQAREFLVSIEANHDINTGGENLVHRPAPSKRTRNRKKVIYGDDFEFGGYRYLINSKPSGIYLRIMTTMMEQLEVCLVRWSRVFMLRFDLHTYQHTHSNQIITKFRKRLFERIKWRYQVDEIGFCWVREQERAKAQHYHFVIFLDGDRIRHSSKLNRIIKDAWETYDGNNHMPVIPRPFVFIDTHEAKKKAVYRISYLAKARGKGYRPPQTKDYGSSRMKIKGGIDDVKETRQ